MKNISKLSYMMILLAFMSSNSFASLNTNELTKISKKSEQIFNVLEKKIIRLSDKNKIVKLKEINLQIEVLLNKKQSEKNIILLNKIKKLIDNEILILNENENFRKTTVNFEKIISKLTLEKKKKLLTKIDKMIKEKSLNSSNHNKLKVFSKILKKEIEIKTNIKPDSGSKYYYDNKQPVGGKVICTELASQGYIDSDIWVGDEIYAMNNITSETLIIYHYWAEPLVKLMRKSKLITNIVYPYGKGWAEHMSFKSGLSKKDNWLGNYIFSRLLPVHNKLSKILIKDKKEIFKDNEIRVNVKSTKKEIFQIILLYFMIIIGLFILPIILIYIIFKIISNIIFKISSKLRYNQ